MKCKLCHVKRIGQNFFSTLSYRYKQGKIDTMHRLSRNHALCLSAAFSHGSAPDTGIAVGPSAPISPSTCYFRNAVQNHAAPDELQPAAMEKNATTPLQYLRSTAAWEEMKGEEA
ncbi:hypothetical protein RY831_02210 [Noviherbaspirillum sp. CPCC 100848]|uniref:Uncharacterized protein n=2 Tax=Noviherbaspirillum album TaxID=3080276 RepID=A0ABU6J2V1_9BURK|nr:hypothetical protein [Noviherbaspirillum sp. CPCC 100848]